MRPSEIKVAFRRSRQPQQYETAEASVSLTLIAEENEEIDDLDETIAEALDTVQAHVYSRLGLVVKEPKPETKAEAEAAPVAAPKKPGRKKAAATEPAAAPAEEKTPEPVAEAPTPAAPAEATVEISDGALTKAIGQTVKKLVEQAVPDGAQNITKLIMSYVSNPPFSQSRIPMEKRQEFLDKLAVMVQK